MEFEALHHFRFDDFFQLWSFAAPTKKNFVVMPGLGGSATRASLLMSLQADWQALP